MQTSKGRISKSNRKRGSNSSSNIEPLLSAYSGQALLETLYILLYLISQQPREV